MKIFFASGFTIMNVKGGEEKLMSLGGSNRLISYNDVIHTSNKVINTINVWGEKIKEQSNEKKNKTIKKKSSGNK